MSKSSTSQKRVKAGLGEGTSSYHTLSNDEVQELLNDRAPVEAVRVLAAYLTYAMKGRAYPSDKTICARGAFNMDVLKQGRAWLEAHGWIEAETFNVGSRGKRHGWNPYVNVTRCPRKRSEKMETLAARSTSKVFSNDMVQLFFLDAEEHGIPHPIEAFRLLSALLVHRDLDTGACFPSDEQIAMVANLDPEEVEWGAARLMDMGWLDPLAYAEGNQEWEVNDEPVHWRSFVFPVFGTNLDLLQIRLYPESIKRLKKGVLPPPRA